MIGGVSYMENRFLLFFLTGPLIFIFTCGATLRDVNRQHHYKPYNKAIYVAQDSRRVWTYGESFGLPTEQEALEKALTHCEQSRSRSGVRSPCTLYSVNGQVVYGRNYTPRVEPRPSGQDPPGNTPGRLAKKSAYGTGFAVSDGGVIVTSHHVIKGGTKIDVQFQDGTVCPAKVLKQSPNIDIAILKIDRPTPNYLPMDSQPEIGVGDRVFTIGFPVEDLLGQEPKFTDGAISSLSGIKGEATFLQITVPIHPGNSGGPLLSEDGKVVGVIAATIAFQPFIDQTRTIPQNINYAVSGSFVAPLLSPYHKEETEGKVLLSWREVVDRARKAVLKVTVE
jgi:S1-C subfamily serine protease